MLTLNLYGNPISEEKDYTLFIAAHFPHLMHLDYRLLDDTTVSKVDFTLPCLQCYNFSMFCCIKYIPCVYVQKNEASMKYHCVIEEMRLEEQQKQQKEDAEKSLEAELQLHKVIQKSGLIMQLLFICLFCIKLTQLLSTIFAGCICGVPQWISTFSKHDQRRS